MINQSTLTAVGLQNRFSANKTEQVSDSVIREALNDFYSIYTRLNRVYRPANERKIIDVTITSAGYDLGLISDIGTTYLRLYKGSLDSTNMIEKRFAGSAYEGWYLVGDLLFLTETADTDVKLMYEKTAPYIEASDDLAAHTLEIDREAEKAMYLYMQTVFYDGRFQLDLRDDAEAKATAELQRFYDSNPVPR